MSDPNSAPSPATGWFSLSRRELLTLVAALGLLLVAVGAARVAGWLWGRGEFAVIEAADALPPAARLNINTAEPYELAMLPGIGPKTAAAIVEWRQAHGPFADWQDVMKVRGVGPDTVDRIRPHAMVAPPAPLTRRRED